MSRTTDILLARDAAEPESGGLVVVIPIYNDWAAAELLLPRLDAALASLHDPSPPGARVLLVDDGSSSAPSAAAFAALPLRGVSRVDVLRLRRNLGHQRAIAIALTYVEQHVPCGAVVVMDGDGEDDPADIARLVERMHADPVPAVVFAARRKRSEGLIFRAFYFLYRVAHRLLTGLPVNVGNFSVVPRPVLRRLVVVSELWNHYAAAVFRSRVPHRAVPTARAPRLAGAPTMNFVALVVHGLSALAVHGELIGVRMLVATIALFVLGALALVGIVAVRLLTTAAIPGWASTVGGITVLLLMQLLVIAVLLTVLTLVGRSNASFIPVRDYVYYIDGEDALVPRTAALGIA